MLRQIFALCVGTLLSLPVFAASFDCAKAATKVETLVCDDRELSMLDEALARAYESARARFGAAAARDQRRWLRLRDGCETSHCLRILYDSRLKELQDSAYSALPKRGSWPGQ